MFYVFQIELSVTPHQTGDLHIVGLAYNLGTSQHVNTTVTSTPNNQLAAPLSLGHNKSSFISSISVRGCVNLEVQGQRLNTSKEEKAGKMYGSDRRLDLIIAPKMPKLEVGERFC